MNTKDNQRSRLTRMLMKQAFLDMMHRTVPGKITVKDNCTAAQLTGAPSICITQNRMIS